MPSSSFSFQLLSISFTCLFVCFRLLLISFIGVIEVVAFSFDVMGLSDDFLSCSFVLCSCFVGLRFNCPLNPFLLSFTPNAFLKFSLCVFKFLCAATRVAEASQRGSAS